MVCDGDDIEATDPVGVARVAAKKQGRRTNNFCLFVPVDSHCRVGETRRVPEADFDEYQGFLVQQNHIDLTDASMVVTDDGSQALRCQEFERGLLGVPAGFYCGAGSHGASSAASGATISLSSE